jgi:hypothetical protein
VPNVNRGDRRRYATVELNKGGSLTLAAPAQYANFLLPLEGALGTDQAADYALSGITFATDGTANTITDSDSGFVSAGVAVGDALYITGFTTAANNGWHAYVTAVAAGSITLDEVVGADLVTEVAGDAVTIEGMRLKDGTTFKSYSTEWELTDLASNFRNAPGMVVSRYMRNWSSTAFSEETVEFIGQAPTHASTTVFTGTAVAAPTYPFMNSLDENVEIVSIGGLTGLELTRLEISINTNARARNAIAAAAGPIGISLGSFDATVSLDYYFDAVGRQLADLVDARTAIDVHIATKDGTNRELWSLASCKPDTGDANPGDPNSDVTGSATFTSFHNTTYDRQIGVWRVDG